MALIIVLLFASTTYAAQFDSKFTKYDPDKCQTLESKTYTTEYTCPGFDEVSLYVAINDRKNYVSPGPTGADELAASQTLSQVNKIDPKIEWRLNKIEGTWAPFATIQKWYIKTEYRLPDEIVVVTKIEEGNTCHIAYLDAAITQQVYDKARNLADLLALKFICTKDTPTWIPEKR